LNDKHDKQKACVTGAFSPIKSFALFTYECKFKTELYNKAKIHVCYASIVKLILHKHRTVLYLDDNKQIAPEKERICYTIFHVMSLAICRSQALNLCFFQRKLVFS